MKGLILAGGHGTRLRPLTHTGPKQLIPLANKANILYCLEDLRDAANTEKFGVAELDGQGHIVSLVEKPKLPKSDLALVGIYLLRTSIFPIIHDLKPSWRNELEITEALDHLRVQGGKLKAHIVTGWWKDTGKPEDILEANHLLLEDIDRKIEGTVEAGARVEGRVRIGARTVVKSGSVIRGPVVIGQDCVVGPETYVGPYTSIGDASQLVGADIESSIVIGEAIIETRHKIVNSLIGRYATIRSADGRLPKGQQLIIGENSSLFL